MKDEFKTKSKIDYIPTTRGMEVSVYHDTGSIMELIATFVDEATYMLCKDALEKDARKTNLHIVENIDYEYKLIENDEQ
jgi:hypothetical protein